MQVGPNGSAPGAEVEAEVLVAFLDLDWAAYAVEELGLDVDELADLADLGVLGRGGGEGRGPAAEVGAEEDVERAEHDDQERDGEDLGDGLEQEAVHEEELEALGEVGVEVGVLPDGAVAVVWSVYRSRSAPGGSTRGPAG